MLELELAWKREGFALQLQEQLPARITGVLGRSGAGKTSLLQLIAGLRRPETGRIVVDGKVLLDSRRGIWLPAHRRRVGLVFQEPRLFPHLSVRANLRYGARWAHGSEQRLSLDQLVSLLELEPLLERKPGALSGGERQRVALGRALLASPRLLLLDEPLTGLDAELRQKVLLFLQKALHAADLPVLYVSHRLEELLQLSSQLLVLDQGQVVARGAWQNLAVDSGFLRHTGAQGLSNLWGMRLAGSEPEGGCCLLRPLQQQAPLLRAPLCGLPEGCAVSVALRPEDVALSRGPVEHVSIQNQLQGKVLRSAEVSGRVLVELEVGFPLLAEISARARDQLGLVPGSPVVALIKVQALRVLGRRDEPPTAQ